MLNKSSKDVILGLSEKEVKKLLEKYGLNEIPLKSETALQRFLKKFWGPIPWMIEIALFLSALVHKWEDFFIILTLLLVNVFVDYKQESKAVSALEVLKKKLEVKTLVLRDGKYKEIEAKFLVPGDIVKLKAGDIVPADAKIIQGDYLLVDQSALTGESLAVSKKLNDILYSSSIVKQGEVLAEITNTGLNTYFGKSVELVSQAEQEEESHLQKAIIKIGDYLIIFSSILAVIILLFSIWRRDSLAEDIQFVLVLLVASIPVALPTVLSVTMAIGAVEIAKHKAVVKKLSALEELAGVNILVSDKTGTLTENKMALGEVKTYNKYDEKELFLYAVLASKEENNDPIEIPIFNYFRKHFKKDSHLSDFILEKFIPFDPVRKRTEAIYKYKNKEIIVSKGAPQVIAGLVSKKEAEVIFKDIEEYSEKGFRVLAVAIKEGNKKKFTAVGVLPLFDPPRKDSQRLISLIKKMGVKVKMLTGDNLIIAKYIASILKIGDRISEIAPLRRKFHKITNDKNKDITERALIQKELVEVVENTDGFAEVYPEDKYFIVDLLQKHQNIVAMTGDGVNDAPALKKADVGIAVLGATNAAIAASDVVLLSPGLKVIHKAIGLARETFERMKSYAIFRIAETIRIILFMFLSIIMFNYYPVTAIMIVVLALLNDIPVMMIAYDNVKLSKKPVRWDMKEILSISILLGVVGVISSFLLFTYLLENHYPLEVIQTMIFLKLDVAGHSTLYLTRTGEKHFWEKPYPSLKFFIPAFSSRIIGTLIAYFGIFMQAIPLSYVACIWLYSLVWWLFNDSLKVFAYKLLKKERKKQQHLIH